MRISIALLLLLAACDSERPIDVGDIPEPQTQSIPAPIGETSAESDDAKSPRKLPTPSTNGTTQATFAGLSAPIPASWTLRPEPRAFRAATFVVPASGGGDQGELAIFAGIGGSDEANIDRWEGQFQEPTGGPGQAVVDPMPEAPFPTTLVELRGNYQGMGMPSPREGMAFLAAIVRVPGRDILHIRLTGPEGTVDAARDDWLAFVAGLSIVDAEGPKP
ncbi:MAG: hypothetical protein CMJ28_07635 [Phycisphaerae bacterium]|nr:hypothetical protein [Phycisphaerae bacterium]